MTTIKIKDTTKQARAVLEMLKTFSFVEIVTPTAGPGRPAVKLSKEEKFYNDFENSLKECTEIIAGRKKGIPLNPKKKTLETIIKNLKPKEKTYLRRLKKTVDEIKAENNFKNYKPLKEFLNEL